jgi:hypothetical protein
VKRPKPQPATFELRGPTLNEVLAKLGYTTSPAAGVTGQLGAKQIIRDGAVAFVGTADDVWKWLRATGQYGEAA